MADKTITDVDISSFRFKDRNGAPKLNRYHFETDANKVKVSYVDNNTTKYYPLQDLCDSYFNFATNANMVAWGQIQPKNPSRFPLWVDTNN